MCTIRHMAASGVRLGTSESEEAMPSYHLTRIKWPKRACRLCTILFRRSFKCEMDACPRTTVRIASATEYIELQRQTKVK
jgi:hypothetical protein